MILRGNWNDTFLKVLVDKKFFTITPVLWGFWGYEVKLHINHKKGEIVEYQFNGKCDYSYVDNKTNQYKSVITFKFGDTTTFDQPEDVCKYILDNVNVYKYIDKCADDKTICKRLSENLLNNYLG
jgi:hypothetical protein